MFPAYDRFIVREFEWKDDALEKQNKEIEELGVEEKELWVSRPFGNNEARLTAGRIA